MTLREVLNESMYQRRNYYGKEIGNSVVSGKEIVGFPDKSVDIPISDDNAMFDIIKLNDGTIEFYVGDEKIHKGTPYKFKECYIGTLKNPKFKDGIGIALECIKRFVNSDKLDEKQKKHLLSYYQEHIKHPYYAGYFKQGH